MSRIPHGAPASFVPLDRSHSRPHESDGGFLFYAMSGLFLTLFSFVLWYCPRHL